MLVLHRDVDSENLQGEYNMCHTQAAVVQTQPHGGTIRQRCFIAKILKNVVKTALEAAAHTAVDSIMM